MTNFEYAKERYAKLGVDVEAAIAKIDSIPVSMHCWQGDDVIGFDGTGELDGGIATTGNYPGRARTAQELRADIDKAISLIPGTVKLNLHACYAEKNGKQIDRDAYTAAEFSGWIDWAVQNKIGLDFNPTYFSHPKMDGNFSLSSLNKGTRDFWIEHGKRCLEIAQVFAESTGKTCAVNFWMPDGYKDTCVDTKIHRELMTQSLDAIFTQKVDESKVASAVESKLFGVGVESYTVASHEYALSYALTRKKLYCLDAGHFHPTEVISAKISAVLCFLDRVLLHISRGVRWDSDHVVSWDGELQAIMDEIIWNDFQDRMFIGLDYFDASINRIAAWVIGMRNARKAMLQAALAPVAAMRKAEAEADYSTRMALVEDRKALPFAAVWEEYCARKNMTLDYMAEIKAHEAAVLSKR